MTQRSSVASSWAQVAVRMPPDRKDRGIGQSLDGAGISSGKPSLDLRNLGARSRVRRLVRRESTVSSSALCP